MNEKYAEILNSNLQMTYVDLTYEKLQLIYEIHGMQTTFTTTMKWIEETPDVTLTLTVLHFDGPCMINLTNMNKQCLDEFYDKIDSSKLKWL